MANFMFQRAGKQGLAVAGVTLTCILVMLMHKVLPLVPNSWNFMKSNIVNLLMLIKRPKFIYAVLNFIILAILISSSSFTNKLNNLLLKIRKNSSHHNISSLISHASQKLVLPDDAWWRRLVSNEDTEQFTRLGDEYEPHLEAEVEKVVRTVSFQAEVVEISEEVEVKECSVEESDQDYAHVVDNEVENDYNEVGKDTLDDRWKAIMDAKNKGGGPQLKKSGTWSSGDPLNRGGVVGGEVGKKGGGGGRLAKYKVELKKWRTFSREDKKDCCGGGGGSGGVRLTYHDELKKRADAFIARFSQDIRLQRLESDQRFLEKLNRSL